MNAGMRLNLEQNDAGLEGGRRTNEELPLTPRADGAHFGLRHKGPHLDQDDDGRGGR